MTWSDFAKVLLLVNLIDNKGDNTHTSALTTTFVVNAKPDLADTATKTATLEGILLNAIYESTLKSQNHD